MAELVVDRLEAVEVHHQQAEPTARAGAPLDLAIHGGEQVGPVVQPGQRIDGGQLDGRISGAALLTSDDHPDVGQQEQRGHVDPDRHELGRRQRRLRRLDGHPDEVGADREGGHQERQPGRQDERRADHDERVGEEERAGRAAGEHEQQRRKGDRHGTLHDVPGVAQDRHGQHVVDGQHEQAGQTEQRKAGGLGCRPQAARRDEYRDSQDDAPADDPNDPVVGRCRDADAGEQEPVGLVAQRRPFRCDAPGAGGGGCFAAPIADEHNGGHARQDEVDRDRDDEQDQEWCSRQGGRPRSARSGGDAPVGAILAAPNVRSYRP